MSGDSPIEQLRGLHLPVEPGWWPPAPGWWVLAILALLLLTLLAWQWRTRRSARRWKTAALVEYRAISSMPAETAGDRAQIVRQCSVLLRRVGLAVLPRSGIAGTTGELWLRQLDTLGRTNAFTHGPGRALLDAPYLRPDETSYDFSAFMSLVGKTIRLAEKGRPAND